MTRRDLVTALAAITLTTQAGCNEVTRSSIIRYRMTITVETPQGVRSGSSVIEVNTVKGRRLGDDAGIGYRVRGEAAVVEMPNGQTMFATLQSKARGVDYPAYLLHSALNNGVVSPPLSRSYEIGDWEAEEAEARTVKPSIVLAETDYPILARFRDRNDPKTVEVVDPSDLQADFGNQVKLHSISITVTTDPVTTGIATKLPSYKSETGVDNWYKSLPFGDPRQISLDHFKREF